MSLEGGGTSAGQRQHGAVVRMRMQHDMNMLHGAEGLRLAVPRCSLDGNVRKERWAGTPFIDFMNIAQRVEPWRTPPWPRWRAGDVLIR